MDETEKRLFVVTITRELVVVASDRDEAQMLAQEEESDVEILEPEYMATPMRHLPADWDLDSVPYGYRDPSEPDREIGAWIEKGAAPEYKVVIDSLRKMDEPPEGH